MWLEKKAASYVLMSVTRRRSWPKTIFYGASRYADGNI